MKLRCEMKKRPFQKKAECELIVDGAVAATLGSGREETVELSPRERYYITLKDKAYSAISVLIPEGESVTLTVERRRNSYSLDVEGARLEMLSLARLLSAMCDEGKLLCLSSWEKNAFYGLLYLDLNQRDALLESPYVLEIRDALEVLGLSEISARLTRAIDACELPLPLDPMKKLTPEEQTALVEGYHILWSREEGAPDGEEAHVLVRIYDYIWEKQRDGAIS